MKNILYALLVLGLTLSACLSDLTETIDKLDNIEGAEWNPNIAFPVLDTRLKLKTVLDELGEFDIIRIGSDGLIYLVYNGEIESKTAEEAIPVPDVSNTEIVVLTPSQLKTLDSLGTLSIVFTRLYSLNYPELEIDSVFFKGGEMQISISSSLEHSAFLTTSITASSKDQISFTDTFAMPFLGQIPVLSSSSTDLNGYVFDYTQTSKGHSELWIEYNIVINKIQGNNIKISEEIELQIDLKNMKFRRFHGFFPADDISTGEEEITIGAFDDIDGMKVEFDEATAKTVLYNSFGVPIEARVTKFEGTSKAGSKLSLSGYPDPLPVPNLGPGDLGKTLADSFEMDKTNSNIIAYLNNRPHDNKFRVNVITNPLGGSFRNWFIDSSKVRGTFEFEMALKGKADSVLIESVDALTWHKDDLENLEKMTIRVYTENGFPIELRLQGYFKDSNNVILDSLLVGTDLLLTSAKVDGAGVVIKPSPNLTDFVFNEARIKRLIRADTLHIIGRMNTTFDQFGNQPSISISDHYDILLQMGIQTKVRIKEKL